MNIYDYHFGLGYVGKYYLWAGHPIKITGIEDVYTFKACHCTGRSISISKASIIRRCREISIRQWAKHKLHGI